MELLEIVDVVIRTAVAFCVAKLSLFVNLILGSCTEHHISNALLENPETRPGRGGTAPSPAQPSKPSKATGERGKLSLSLSPETQSGRTLSPYLAPVRAGQCWSGQLHPHHPSSTDRFGSDGIGGEGSGGEGAQSLTT